MSFDFISALYDEPPPLRGNAASSADRNDHDAIIDEITRGCDSAVASTNAEYLRSFERNRDNLNFFRDELESELRSELRDQTRRRPSDHSENSNHRLTSNSNSNSNNFLLSNNYDSDYRSSNITPGAAPAPASSRHDVAVSSGFEGHGASLGLSDFVGVLSSCNHGQGSDNGGASAGGVRSNSTPNSGGDWNSNGGPRDFLAATERRRSSNGDGSTYTSITTAPVASVASGTSTGGASNNRPSAARPPSMSASALAATSAEELNIQLTRWLNEAVPLTSAASAMTSALARSSSATRSRADDDGDVDSSHFGSLLPNALATSAANRAVALQALRTADPEDLMRLDANLNAAVGIGWNTLPSLDALRSALSLDPLVHDPNLAGASRPLYRGIGRIGSDTGDRRFDALGWGEANFQELLNDSSLPGRDTAIVARSAIAGTDQHMLYSNNNNNNNNVINSDNPINMPSVSLSHLARGPTELAGLLTAGSSLGRFRNQDGVLDSRSLTSVRTSASNWGNNTNNISSENNMVPLAGSSASDNNGSNTITSVPSRYESTTMLSATDILRRLLSRHDSSRELPAPQRPLVEGSNQTGSGSSISESSNSDNRSCSVESSNSSSSGGGDNSSQHHGAFSSTSSSSGDNDNSNIGSDWIAHPLQLDDDIESIGTVDQDPEADLNDEEIEAGDDLDTSLVANTFESTPILAVIASTSAAASASSSASASTSHTNSATVTASMTSTTASAIGNLESSTTTTIAQPQGHRVRRQAAIRGMERISTALATHGMGGSDSPVDMSNNMDRKPSANRKRSTSQGHANDSKKRPIVQMEYDLNTKQPAIKLQEAKPSATKKAEEEEEAPATCCICLEEPTFEELASIDVCKHPFCFSCIEKWADRENTCPLCKTRFMKIVRVNKPKRKRKGVDSDGAPQEKARNVKRVRQRDQRHDYSFSNPLQGIFASMEANGTWPTHIAQLLFSGLGANTMRGRERGRATGRPFGVAAASATGPPAASAASDSFPSYRERSGMAPPPVRPSTRYNRSTAGAVSSAAAESSRARTNSSRPQAHPAMGSVLNRVSVSRHDSYEIGGVAASSAFGAPRYSSSRPHHSSSTASATHAPIDRTPWSAHASISVTYGPDGFVRRTSSPASRLSGFGGHGRPGTAAVASASATGNSSGGTVSFNTDEEEDLLSSLSPSSYIRRIHRQMDRNNRATLNNSYSGQHHFSTVSSSDSSARFSERNASTTSSAASTTAAIRGFTSSHRDPLDQYFLHSSLPNYFPTPIAPHVERENRRAAALRTSAVNAAGRTAETALEIDDDSDDDDVVEVLEIAANV